MRLLLFCLLPLPLLLSCAGTVDDAEFAAPPAADVGQLNDWAMWDWRVNRGNRVTDYCNAMVQPDDAFDQYLRAVTYRARPDSMGLGEFLSLPAERQRERRLEAAGLREKAWRIQALVRDRWFATQSTMVAAGLNPAGYTDSLTRALGYLVTANGVDPSHPSSCYDEAYFCGIIGDQVRQQAALDAALAAIAAHAERDGAVFRDLRLRIALDYAWLLREQGWYERCLTWLDRADELTTAESLRPVDSRNEARVLRGLVMAETGRYIEMEQISAQLRHLKTYEINAGAGGASLIKTTWQVRLSAFAANWIRALAHAGRGLTDLVTAAAGDDRAGQFRPIQLDYRFWQDRGLIYERIGNGFEARKQYHRALSMHPYFIYFPLQPVRGPDTIRGLTGGGGVFFRSYEHFFVGGSLFAHATFCASMAELEENPRRRRMLVDLARQSLGACRRRGIRPAEALALRGFLDVFLGNHETAAADLQLAWAELRVAGRASPNVAMMAGVLLFNTGDKAGALECLRDAVTLDANSADAWRAYAVAVLFAGDTQQARLAMDRAVELGPEAGTAWYNRGLLNWTEGRRDDALVDLRRAVELMPGNEAVIGLLARIEYDGDSGAEELDMMAAEVDTRLGRDEAEALVGGTEAGIIGTVGTGLEAVPVPEGIVAAAIADSSLANLEILAAAYLQANQPEEARRTLLPLWSRGISISGTCLVLEADRALGDPTRARALAESLIEETEPVSDVRFWTLVALVCGDHGLNVEAIRALDVAIELDPANRALWRQRRFLAGP